MGPIREQLHMKFTYLLKAGDKSVAEISIYDNFVYFFSAHCSSLCSFLLLLNVYFCIVLKALLNKPI